LCTLVPKGMAATLATSLKGAPVNVKGWRAALGRGDVFLDADLSSVIKNVRAVAASHRPVEGAKRRRTSQHPNLLPDMPLPPPPPPLLQPPGILNADNCCAKLLGFPPSAPEETPLIAVVGALPAEAEAPAAVEKARPADEFVAETQFSSAIVHGIVDSTNIRIAAVCLSRVDRGQTFVCEV